MIMQFPRKYQPRDTYLIDPEEVAQEDAIWVDEIPTIEAEPVEDDEIGDGMSDVEADADTLRSAGWGTDEDYGYYGEDDDHYS